MSSDNPAALGGDGLAQTIEGAVDPPTATIQYVRVGLRGLGVLAPQEFLDGSDVAAVLQ